MYYRGQKWAKEIRLSKLDSMFLLLLSFYITGHQDINSHSHIEVIYFHYRFLQNDYNDDVLQIREGILKLCVVYIFPQKNYIFFCTRT